MAQVVRLYRDAAEKHGRDLFACTRSEWSFLLDIGRAFGWQPRGTTYELPIGSKRQHAALRDYEPSAAGDQKRVAAEDAIAWARALQDAYGSPQFESMIEARAKNGAAAESSAGSIAEFVEYAFGGAFTFALEEDASPTVNPERL